MAYDLGVVSVTGGLSMTYIGFCHDMFMIWVFVGVYVCHDMFMIWVFFGFYAPLLSYVVISKRLVLNHGFVPKKH